MNCKPNLKDLVVIFPIVYDSRKPASEELHSRRRLPLKEGRPRGFLSEVHGVEGLPVHGVRGKRRKKTTVAVQALFRIMEKHTCKLYFHSFASGQELGGDMRSHVAVAAAVAVTAAAAA
ncbi:hypothetical protein AXF42_Ash014785 [Apostasia shenzhenica]|uniref:Uncharacterized protein n=1 Tax=Apostasia shenzhenica TaxID=1088818 RepID=A0A2H9ZWB0_9ASPA|nr:hypothetical protein AXF42_Ash014785 [Apostasia shenzhenica]